jgi:hypothetical protein
LSKGVTFQASEVGFNQACAFELSAHALKQGAARLIKVAIIKARGVFIGISKYRTIKLRAS